MISAKILLKSRKSFEVYAKLYKTCTSSFIIKRWASNSDLTDQKYRNKILTIPNIITFSRILSAPFLTYAVYHDMKMAALCGCVAAGFTDFLDGFIAKRFNMKSNLGEFLDPFADKVLISCLAIGLASKSLLPLSLVGLIVVRDVALIGGSFYLRLKEKPSLFPLSEFFDLQATKFNIQPSLTSKINTATQFACLASTLYCFLLDDEALKQTVESMIVQPMWYITASTTIASGLGYIDGSGVRKKVLVVTDAIAVRAPRLTNNVMTKANNAMVKANSAMAKANSAITKMKSTRMKWQSYRNRISKLK